ncbi:hypothetical protein [Georgenia thermotolerans]|uniref:Uncharacterized protein n=1 Tax=Georgenia thermotolerans TaxID=527326 RepID=A0A7J5UPT6_9MICO|nr:hypothetical protein [Georgenia thermotolerans]KAE8764428.1 hypothetical protein GB883_09125 [Georgenia thermotolerans]
MEPTTVPVSAAAAISGFFAHDRVLRRPGVRDTAAFVRRHLETYLDTEAERWLGPDDRVLVAAEREVDPAGAVARVTGPAVLVAALPGFLDPAWLLPARAARVQLLLVAELLGWLERTGLVDGMAYPVLAARAALARAEARLAAGPGPPVSRSAPPGRPPPGSDPR